MKLELDPVADDTHEIDEEEEISLDMTYDVPKPYIAYQKKQTFIKSLQD